MGGKQSTVGDVSVGHSPVIRSIQDAYKSGDTSKAQELIKLSCEENILQVEKVEYVLSVIGSHWKRNLPTLGLDLQLFLMQKAHSLLSYNITQKPTKDWSLIVLGTTQAQSKR